MTTKTHAAQTAAVADYLKLSTRLEALEREIAALKLWKSKIERIKVPRPESDRSFRQRVLAVFAGAK
jgi:hypothetical protein